MQETLRRRMGAALEAGRIPHVWPLRWAEGAWARWAKRNLKRATTIPSGCRVFGIGSAVLGGAGKTPICIALARALAARRSPSLVAVVGHAYRGEPGHARVVRPTDDVAIVGDDALYAARALAPDLVAVVVAPTRNAALQHAASLGADTLIVDGLLRAPSGPNHQSVLVLDADRPWGNRCCPPLGDLRAPPAALLAASSVVAWTCDVAAQPLGEPLRAGIGGRTLVPVPADLSHARSADGRLFALMELPHPIGLVTTVAHPERVARALERRDLPIADWVRLADHATAAEATRVLRARSPMGVWLAPARSAETLPADVGGVPILALEQQLDVAELLENLIRRAETSAELASSDPSS